jgi:hypothetical protein
MREPRSCKMFPSFMYLWVESILDENGHVQQVWCNIHTFVQRKDKLLVPKFDSLLKHQNHWKAIFSMSSKDARNEAQR